MTQYTDRQVLKALEAVEQGVVSPLSHPIRDRLEWYVDAVLDVDEPCEEGHFGCAARAGGLCSGRVHAVLPEPDPVTTTPKDPEPEKGLNYPFEFGRAYECLRMLVAACDRKGVLGGSVEIECARELLKELER